jgi:hypothetical protein
MLHALCGIAAACTVAGQPARVLGPTTALQSPPRVIEAAQQVATPPRQRRAVRNPPAYLDQRNLDQDTDCEAYNCIGPRTDFRLPDEIPYSEYEQQYTGRPSGR